MFNIQDNTEEDQNLSLQMDGFKDQLNKLQLQVLLEVKEKELFKEKLTQMEKQNVISSVSTKTEGLSSKEKDLDRLVCVLQKIIDKGDSSNKPEEQKELDKDWEEICSMLDHYRNLKIAKDQEPRAAPQPVRQEDVVVITEEIQNGKDAESTEIQDGGKNTVSKESMDQMGAEIDGILRKIMQAYRDDSTEEEK